MKTLSIMLLGFCGVLLIAASGAVRAEDAAAKAPPKLVILKAQYGDLPDGAKTDVTEKVKAMVKPEGLTVEATNDNFGDPIEGTAKKLTVEFTLDDQKLSRTVNENETLTISLVPSKLKIISAFYGDLPNGPKTDVTLKVQLMVKADALEAAASNENFGDPIEGTQKKLKVEYSFNGGAAKTKEAVENETLTISNTGE